MIFPIIFAIMMLEGNDDMEKAFYDMIKPIIKTPNYQSMKNYRHHKCYSTFYHSIKVAYLAYLFVKKHHCKVDLASLIRGALLHDYYLYDWHDKSWYHRPHGFKHPRIAYKNAVRDYENINKIEKDIILHHMFPLTIIPPHTKEGWIITYCDKKAGFDDYKRRQRKKAR